MLLNDSYNPPPPSVTNHNAFANPLPLSALRNLLMAHYKRDFHWKTAKHSRVLMLVSLDPVKLEKMPKH